MEINRLFVEQKYSILNIFQIMVPLSVAACIIYAVHLINTQVAILEKNVSQLTKTLVTVEQKNLELQQMLNEKILELQDLKLTVQDQIVIANTTKGINPEILIAQNEMTQFYIKTAGSICLVALVFGSIYYVSGFSLSAKALLPAGLYEVMQDNSSFFQTSKLYNFHETNSNTHWLIKVINEKRVADLTVKPEHSPDFMSVWDFISTLHSRAGTLTKLRSIVKEEAVSPLFRVPIESVVDPLAAPAVESAAAAVTAAVVPAAVSTFETSSALATHLSNFL